MLQTEPGSYKATLALQEPTSQQLVDLGEDAIDALLAGISSEMTGEPGPVLPDQARQIIQETIIRPLGHGTTLTLRGGKRSRVVVISEEAAKRLPRTSQSFRNENVQIVGRLLEVDFKDYTAEVWDASGKMTRVRFSEDLADAIHSATRSQVVVSGNSETDAEGRTRTFEVQEVSPLSITDDFWRNPSLDDLVSQQGVNPVRSVSDFISPSLNSEDAQEMLSELDSLRTL